MKLHKFQQEGVKFLLNKKSAVLADEMGLGKTAQTISACKYIISGPESIWVIVCPKTVQRVWLNEFQKWYPNAKVEILKGTSTKKMITIENTLSRFVIVTYESLHSILPALKKREIVGFIADEAHKLKNRKSRMHKAFSEIRKEFPNAYCFCLTGTPIMNRAEEMWSLLHMLHPFEYTNFHLWADRYLRAEHKYIPGQGWVKQYNVPRNPEAFQNYLSQYVLRRLKTDAIDLPPKTYSTIEVELEGEQLKHYCNMRDFMYMQWETDEKEGREVTATAIIAAITRLKQLAVSAELITDDKHKPLTGAKIEALEELIEENNGHKLVIFSQFSQAAIRLKNQFSNKYECELIHGGTSEIERSDAINRFQNGNSQLIFLSTKTGGTGITLTAASSAVFLDLMWTPADNAQAADRIYRIGQTRPVNIYYIKAVNTVEDRVLSILERKEELFEMTIPTTRFETLTNIITKNWRDLLR